MRRCPGLDLSPPDNRSSRSLGLPKTSLTNATVRAAVTTLCKQSSPSGSLAITLCWPVTRGLRHWILGNLEPSQTNTTIVWIGGRQSSIVRASLPLVTLLLCRLVEDNDSPRMLGECLTRSLADGSGLGSRVWKADSLSRFL